MPVPDFSPGEVLTAAAMDSIGLWKVTAATVTAQPTLTVDNCFSANYDNYRVIVSMNGVSNFNYLAFRVLDSGGSQLSSNYLSSAYAQDYASATTAFTVLNSSALTMLGYLPNTSGGHGPMAVQFDIFNPFASGLRTQMNGLHTGVESGTAFKAGACFMSRSTQEVNRGLVFLNGVGTNMTGTVQVFGYRN